MKKPKYLPARIWATPAYTDWDAKFGEWVTKPEDGALEYIRADMVATLKTEENAK